MNEWIWKIALVYFCVLVSVLVFIEVFFKSPSQKGKRVQTEDLVSHLVVHTASLELAKDEYVELAPIKGCCGPFKLTGNSLPAFEYVVFDKQKEPLMMEFIKVRVEVSRPDRIEYTATIESKNTEDKARHGEVLVVKEEYKAPFQKLADHLYNYFPLFRAKGNGIKKVS